MKQIDIKKIIEQRGVQPRDAIESSAIKDYAEAMREGAKFPPIVVFDLNDDYYLLAHGFHRYRAAISAGLLTIAAEVKKGDIHDAILFAVGANREQGKIGVRFSNADKRRSVEMLLGDERWREWSDRRIAQAVGVSDRFVNGLRSANGSQLGTVPSSTRVGLDGKRRPAGKPRKPKAEKGGKDGERGEDGDGGRADEAPVGGEGGLGVAEEAQGHRDSPSPTRRDVGVEGDPKGEQAGDPPARGRGDSRGIRESRDGVVQVDWNEEAVRLGAGIKGLIKDFEGFEDRFDSLLAGMRDFDAFSGLKKEWEVLHQEALGFVKVANRISSKLIDLKCK